MDQEIQDLYAQKQSLQVVGGILYRNYVRPDGSLQFRQVVVPRSLRVLFIDAAHCGPLNGHLGIDKTQAKLKQFAYWRGWTSDVMLQVKRCSVCNQYRHGPRQKQGQLQQASGCAPMQKVHVDLVEPGTKSYQQSRTSVITHSYLYFYAVFGDCANTRENKCECRKGTGKECLYSSKMAWQDGAVFCFYH